MKPDDWLKFLRRYGPIPRNDNMYDETIHRLARRQKISPIDFEHPYQTLVLRCFEQESSLTSVILTGTAGDGKTHLCRKVWEILDGKEEDWESDSPYLKLDYQYNKRQKECADSRNTNTVTVHFIRDLSAWAPQHGTDWDPEKQTLLDKFCQSIFNPGSNEFFLIAGNDGQLIESWRRLNETETVLRTRKLFEDLLVEDKREQSGVRLKFYNLSRSSSADLLDLALNAFLNHPAWSELINCNSSENDLFGPRCPIRYNYELLQRPLVQERLRSLIKLCDYNGLHVPIRQILLLLTNSILGHPDAKDHLMRPIDVPKIIAAGTVSKASLYNNIFGGNLPERRRETIIIFDYLEKFQIGYETSNRVDNILIFGERDEHFGQHFDEFLSNDRFYGADARYYAAKKEYIEGNNENDEHSGEFLDLLVSQRRGLFFKIPKELDQELNLWELTVFKFAGEYLESVVGNLKSGNLVKRPILSRLVRGLNRVFTGMLLNSERELYLATSGNYSQAKVCRILVERVSVDPSKGEKIVLKFDHGTDRILLSVYFAPDLCVDFNLTLIRYEFLSRIAMEGALPASFSKECYEDLLAFKSQLIAVYMTRQSREGVQANDVIGLNLLRLTEQGMPNPKFVEILP